MKISGAPVSTSTTSDLICMAQGGEFPEQALKGHDRDIAEHPWLWHKGSWGHFQNLAQQRGQDSMWW